MRNEADADHRDKVIKAGGQAAWEHIAVPNTKLTDSLWKQISSELDGEAAAHVLAAQAYAIEKEELATGQADSFLRTEQAHASNPGLTKWRFLLNTITNALPGKKKLILDPKTPGRRHLLLGTPDSLDASALPYMPAMNQYEDE